MLPNAIRRRATRERNRGGHGLNVELQSAEWHEACGDLRWPGCLGARGKPDGILTAKVHRLG